MKADADSWVPGLWRCLAVRVELPDKVLLVDLPHLVPWDLFYQQELRGHGIWGQDTSAEISMA